MKFSVKVKDPEFASEVFELSNCFVPADLDLPKLFVNTSGFHKSLGRSFLLNLTPIEYNDASLRAPAADLCGIESIVECCFGDENAFILELQV